MTDFILNAYIQAANAVDEPLNLLVIATFCFPGIIGVFMLMFGTANAISGNRLEGFTSDAARLFWRWTWVALAVSLWPVVVFGLVSQLLSLSA